MLWYNNDSGQVNTINKSAVCPKRVSVIPSELEIAIITYIAAHKVSTGHHKRSLRG